MSPPEGRSLAPRMPKVALYRPFLAENTWIFHRLFPQHDAAPQNAEQGLLTKRPLNAE